MVLTNYNRFVMAPGVRIASTYKDNSYVYLQGTSMATPFVAGVAALLVSQTLRAGRSVPVEDIYAILRESATDVGSPYFYGEGLVDTQGAVEAMRDKLS